MHLRIIIGIFTLFLAQSVYMARSSQKRNAMGSVPFLGESDSSGEELDILTDPLMVEFRRKMTEVPVYSLDSRPDWLPTGWDMERVMDMTMEDWAKLTEDKQDNLRAGLEAYCGTEFKNEFFSDMFARSGLEPSNEPPTLPPNFLRVLRRRQDDTQDWGFVFYRTTYDQTDEEWSEIKQRLNTIVESTFDYYNNIDGVPQARQRWKLLWVEDSTKFDNAAMKDVAAHYRTSMEKLPGNYQHSLLFAVDQASARSLMLADVSVEKMSERPRLGEVVPFVIAMDAELGLDELNDGEKAEDEDEDADADEDEDLENWNGPFRAHPSSIVDEIYTIVASQMMTTYEFAYAAHGSDGIWWASHNGIWTVDDEGRYAERHFESAAQLRLAYREKKEKQEKEKESVYVDPKEL